MRTVIRPHARAIRLRVLSVRGARSCAFARGSVSRARESERKGKVFAETTEKSPAKGKRSNSTLGIIFKYRSLYQVSCRRLHHARHVLFRERRVIPSGPLGSPSPGYRVWQLFRIPAKIHQSPHRIPGPAALASPGPGAQTGALKSQISPNPSTVTRCRTSTS